MANDDKLLRVGRTVAARRGELRLTQTELAEMAGVDPKTVHNLEAGARWPIARNRVALSAALGWTADALTAIRDGDAAPPPPLAAAPDLSDLAGYDDDSAIFGLILESLPNDVERMVWGVRCHSVADRVGVILELRERMASGGRIPRQQRRSAGGS